MEEMHWILKFTNLESISFEKAFLCTSDRFSLLGVIFTLLKFFQFQTSLKIYSGKPNYII